MYNINEVIKKLELVLSKTHFQIVPFVEGMSDNIILLKNTQDNYQVALSVKNNAISFVRENTEIGFIEEKRAVIDFDDFYTIRRLMDVVLNDCSMFYSEGLLKMEQANHFMFYLDVGLEVLYIKNDIYMICGLFMEDVEVLLQCFLCIKKEYLNS